MELFYIDQKLSDDNFFSVSGWVEFSIKSCLILHFKNSINKLTIFQFFSLLQINIFLMLTWCLAATLDPSSPK
jgi:hypothetical protein